MPFPAPNSILGPEGESWVPVHGQASLSTAPAMFAEIRAYFDSMQETFDKHGIFNGFLFSSLSTTALVIEPVFFWPEGYRPIHESMVEPAHLKNLKQLGPNAEATVVVTEARVHVKAISYNAGILIQGVDINKADPPAAVDEAFKDVLDAVKAVVDPRGVFNPGCLGFPIREGRN